GYEDTEICWRAWLRDWKVMFVPEAVCWHRVGGSVRSRQAALMYFSGILKGRLILSTKLLPLRYALRTWLVTAAGVAKDVFFARWRYVITRIQVLLWAALQIPVLLRERQSLFRSARRTAQQHLDSLLRLVTAI